MSRVGALSAIVALFSSTRHSGNDGVFGSFRLGANGCGIDFSLWFA
jgi:hypothetical protein